MPKHDDPTEIEPRPQPAPRASTTATVAQLKRDIDSGGTGDKVAMLDPAASPLGTDDEAAGAPPSPELVAATRARERRNQPSPEHPADRPRDENRAARRRGAAALLGLALIGLLLAWASLGYGG